MIPSLREAIGEAVGVTVTRLEPCAGGDICEAFRADTSDGPVFVKARAGAAPGFFTAEAEGLSWLGEAQAVAVPAVVAVAGEWLALEWIDQGPVPPDGGEKLGVALARLHRAGAPAFGSERDGWIGSVAVSNKTAPTWGEFFVERRLRPLARLAICAGSVDPAAAALVDRVAARISELAGPTERPARVHGDLWAGNIVWSRRGEPWLVDPAAHGGHREVDLAMLSLFGGAPPRWLDAYHCAYPLTEGWRERIQLHQLTPLLVHAILFGGGYGSKVVSVLRRYC